MFMVLPKVLFIGAKRTLGVTVCLNEGSCRALNAV